jgi:hypothetical protein
MHRTLQQETASPAAANRRAQQKAFDRFRQEYNQVCPQEALAMPTPAACDQASSREYPARVREPEYGRALRVRRVQQHGEFYWKHQPVFRSEVMSNERIGLLPVEEHGYIVYSGRFPRARFDRRRLKVLRLPDGHHFYGDEAEEGEPPPSSQSIPKPKSVRGARSKLSGISPAVQKANDKALKGRRNQCRKNIQPLLMMNDS